MFMIRNNLGWRLRLVLIVIVIAVVLLLKPGEVEYPAQPMSPDYQRNMRHLQAATMRRMPKLPDNMGGLYGMDLAIVSEDDFPLLTKKLRQVFHEASSHFLFHLITIGGQNVERIDEPLLEASEGLRRPKTPNIKLVIVAPSTISPDTERILLARGILVERI